MNIYAWTFATTMYAAVAQIFIDAARLQYPRQPMLRGFDFPGAMDVPAPAPLHAEPAQEQEFDTDAADAPEVVRSLGVSWVPSDLRTGKISLLPSFPPTPPQPSDTPVMAPSVVPAARELGVSWMPSDLRTGNVSRLPTFPPQPTPSPTVLSNAVPTVRRLGVSWMPSDLRTGNVSRLPTFPPVAPATPKPTASRNIRHE